MAQYIAEVVVSHVAIRIERDSQAVVFLGLVKTAAPHIKIGDLHETLRVFALCQGAGSGSPVFSRKAGPIGALRGLAIR